MKISVNEPLLLLKTAIHTVHRWIMNNKKMGLPLCHVVSGAMQCYDCARRMRTRAEHFSLLLQSRLWGYAVQRSESSFWLSNFTLYTPQLLDTHLGVATDTLMCVATPSSRSAGCLNICLWLTAGSVWNQILRMGLYCLIPTHCWLCI
jgi:hypothetical protein